MSSQYSLFRRNRFLPFFLTQFFGAFNDNLFKNALVVLLTYQATQWTRLQPEILANLAAGIFILPFFLFSATAGQLADKYDKAWLARLVKILEIVIMGVASLGFWFHNLALLLGTLFLLGLQSTFFGPVKYAILPQHLKEEELVGGNALVEAGTFVAILIGTLAGGLMAGLVTEPVWIAGAGGIVALIGYLASRSIPPAPAPEPELAINPNPVTETWRNINFARKNRTVFLSILGISWFWLYGALFLAQFPAFAKNVLGGGETTVTLLLAIFTVGIGLGSLLCERLSGNKVEIGLVPFGSIGLSIFAFDLALASPTGNAAEGLQTLSLLLSSWSTWRVLVDLLLIGVFGGFFIVPLYALVQVRSAVAHRARIIAANNILNALFMVLGALGAAALLSAGIRIPQLFAIAAACNTLVALYIYGLVPEFLLRFVLWLALRLTCRLTIVNSQYLPQEGPAVLLVHGTPQIRNAMLILGATSHPIRFLVESEHFKRPVLGYFLRQSGAISYHGPTSSALLSLPEVREALQNKEVIGLFSPTAQAESFTTTVRVQVQGEQRRFRPAFRLQVEPSISSPEKGKQE